MEREASRRDVLRVALTGGGAALLAGVGGWLLREEPGAKGGWGREERALVRNYGVAPREDLPEVVRARGEARAAVRACVTALGGMARFISPGDTVLIKPNVGWDRTPEYGANTSPEVVAVLVALCREAGAGEILVTDVSCNDPQRCFHRSGVGAAAQQAGAKIVLPSRFVEVPIHGRVLDRWPVTATVLKADKIINVPAAKHHSLAGATMALKNWYGLIGGKRNRLHQDIHRSVADLAAFIKPTLTVLDATRVLFRNGPTGGSLGDVRREDLIIASTDPVAVDALAVPLLGLQAGDVPYIRMAELLGVGTASPQRVEDLRSV